MQNDTQYCRPDSSLSRGTFIEVWDLPIRVFHWTLVALLATAVVSGKIGGNAMETHLQAGYAIIVLLVFRLLWGFVGTPHARFGSFIRGLPSVVRYCRGLSRGATYAYRGHNPLGGWMVVIMLSALAVQAGTGLFSNDDIMAEGPFMSLVDKDTSDILTGIHKLNFKLLAGLAGLHILAIAFYAVVKRINLVGPMITGRMPATGDPSPVRRKSPAYANALALALLVLVGTGLYLLLPAA